MSRPRSDDPQVPLPVRVPTSLLDHLRRQATESGQTLTSLVRSRIDDRSGLRPGALAAPQAKPQAGSDKTEHVDLRAGAPVCECEKPKISAVAPICTICGRRRP